MRDRYLSIMDYFGYRNQMRKLNEECYELIEAIDNLEDYNKKILTFLYVKILFYLQVKFLLF